MKYHYVPPTEMNSHNLKLGNFSSDYVFSDAQQHNSPIINKILLSNNPYLKHLLSIHHPKLYIHTASERLNSGATEDLYIFSFCRRETITILIENINSGKATLCFGILIDKVNNGQVYNKLLFEIKQFFNSTKINKRSKIFSAEDFPFSAGGWVDHVRISHTNFEDWMAYLHRQLRFRPKYEEPSCADLAPVSNPISNVLLTSRILDPPKRNKKKKFVKNKPVKVKRKPVIKASKVIATETVVADKAIFISSNIGSYALSPLFRFIRHHGGRVVMNEDSAFDLAVVSDLSILQEQSHSHLLDKIAENKIPVYILSDLLRYM